MTTYQGILNMTASRAIECGSDKRPVLNANFSDSLGSLAARILAATGAKSAATWWPYRHLGSKLWAFDVTGEAGSVSMTFVETGRAQMPTGNVHDAIGELSDSVDAHYVLRFLSERLAQPASTA